MTGQQKFPRIQGNHALARVDMQTRPSGLLIAQRQHKLQSTLAIWGITLSRYQIPPLRFFSSDDDIVFGCLRCSSGLCCQQHGHQYGVNVVIIAADYSHITRNLG